MSSTGIEFETRRSLRSRAKTITPIVAILMCGCSVLPEQEGERLLKPTVDVTYMSRLMDKGGEYYGSSGALLETISVDLWGTGLTAAVGHRTATSGGWSDKERFDYKVAYERSLFVDQSYEAKAGGAWIYHEHPNSGPHGDFQEWEAFVSFPNLLPKGIVAGYKTCGEHGNHTGISSADWWHVLTLDKELPLSLEANYMPEALNLHADIAARDGLGGIRDWTHATLGVSTEVSLTGSFFLVLGGFHQFSLSDLLTPDDVSYATLSLQYRH